MELWLDSIDKKILHSKLALSLLDGVTTNPSILSEAYNVNETIHDILSLNLGTLAIQVTCLSSKEMIQQAKDLHTISHQILVKIPITTEGLVAIKHLSLENIPTLGTAIVQPKQAYLAAKANASYIAPYLSHMSQDIETSFSKLQTILNMYEGMTEPPKILVASIKDVDQIVRCAEIGVDAVTIKEDLFKEFTQDVPLSNSFTKRFNEKWKNTFQNNQEITQVAGFRTS